VELAQNSKIIEARGVTKQFGNEIAVQDITFEIPRGTIFGFIGPSGCGKTTTVRLLTGLYEPSAGRPGCWVNIPKNLASISNENWLHAPTLRALSGFECLGKHKFCRILVWSQSAA